MTSFSKGVSMVWYCAEGVWFFIYAHRKTSVKLRAMWYEKNEEDRIMKKTVRFFIAILTVGLMLIAFVGCDEKDEDDNSMMNGIFEKLQSDEGYSNINVTFIAPK